MTITSVPFYRHGLSAADGEAVTKVLGSPFLTSGAVGRGVEAQLCAFFSVGHAKLTNSWTNGAVATLLALDIGAGDEVIVPAMTFIASSNVVELLGAKAVFVDVDPDTLLIDINAAKAAITERTKAIIPVHLYGQMVDIKALRAAMGSDIAIIEDCAHAFESTLNGERPGAHSDAAIFSFYATKNVTCGEGGAIITGREDLAGLIAQTVLHGMSAGAADRFSGKMYRHWGMQRLGTKANLPDLLACLLPAQIETVGARLAQRKALVARYRAAFAQNPHIQMVAEVPGGVSAEHLFPIAVPLGTRDEVLTRLNEAGIGTTVNYRAVHRMEYYQSRYGFADDAFPIAANWGDRTLCLPLFPGLGEDEQDYVIAQTLKTVNAITTA